MAVAVILFVVEKLGNLLIQEVASLYDVHGQVESIESELTRMQCFLKDADVKQKSDERVRNWIRDIRDIAYDVEEDIIDTFVLKLSCQQRSFGFMGLIETTSCKYCFHDLAARHQLVKDIQKIKQRIYKLHLSSAMENLPAPGQIQSNLTKLTLKMSRLVQDPLMTLGRLPNLKMLRLLSNSFCGKEMVCASGGFPKLHCLEIGQLDELEEWKVEVGALPNLRCLNIHECEKLRMLPEGLQYLATLREVILEDMADAFEDRVQQD